jgi:hypothetical protein
MTSSSTAPSTTPATFLALAVRRRRRLPCAILLGTGLVADAVLAAHTIAAERAYFERLYAAEPGFMLLWIALWLGWQAAALAALLASLLATDPGWE